MRGLAKSFASFTWAMTMFGLEQLTNMVSEERSGNREERMTGAFDAMTSATGKVLGERSRSMFDAGDRLQREMVDLTFDVFRPENWSPEKLLERAADVAESSADALRDAGKKKEEDTAEGANVSASESSCTGS